MGADRGSLDREGIVAAALEIVDRDGLAALTMRRLGDALGVEAMSIYHHVPNKAALHDALVDTLVPDSADGAAVAWRTVVVERCTELRRGLLAHPHLAELFGTGAPAPALTRGPGRDVADALARCGFDAEAAQWIANVAVALVVGSVLVELASAPGDGGLASFELGLQFLTDGIATELGE